MQLSEQDLIALEEPQDYYNGVGKTSPLSTPTNILLFLRKTKKSLQQETLKNRSHHRFVLIVNLETTGHVHVDHHQFPLKPKQALLIPPYHFHQYSHLASPSLSWLICTFEIENRSVMQPMGKRVIDLQENSFFTLEQLLKEWRHCSAKEGLGELQNQQLQTSLIKLLLSLEQNLQRSASDLPPEPRDNLLRKIHRLMAEWRGQPVIVRDLAEALKISESRLRVQFKESSGIPLGKYIQNYRLSRAMALLRTTNLSNADIAEEAGFGSPQAFNRSFKQMTGQTPRAYRSAG